MLRSCRHGCLVETGRRKYAMHYLLGTARRGRPTVYVNFRRSCSDVTCVLLLVVCPALCHNSVVACINNFGVNSTGSICPRERILLGYSRVKTDCVECWIGCFRQQKRFDDTNSQIVHSRIRTTLDEDLNSLICWNCTGTYILRATY
jgi:hypothetical protein